MPQNSLSMIVSVVEAIVNNAATRDVDPIVIGTRDHSGFTKLLMGAFLQEYSTMHIAQFSQSAD